MPTRVLWFRPSRIVAAGAVYSMLACSGSAGVPGDASIHTALDSGAMDAVIDAPADGASIDAPDDAGPEIDPLVTCFVDPSCPGCATETCAGEWNVAFGSSGACLALAECLRMQDCNPACTSEALVEPCAGALRSLVECTRACVSMCRAPRCGDGRIDGAPEECDGETFLDRDDCIARGFASGTLTCTSDCRVDASRCMGCGAGCGGCCVAGRCAESSASACRVDPTSGGASSCIACEGGQACRFSGTAFMCIDVHPDGDRCARSEECVGEVCSEGRCFSGCGGTHARCDDRSPCCNPLATCAPPPVPGASRECCASDGTIVGSAIEACSLCCPGLSCGGGPLGGEYRCRR